MSRILILGGNGQTGVHAVNEALDRGFKVTALVRNPDTMEARDGLTIVKGTDIVAARRSTVTNLLDQGSPLVLEDIENAYQTTKFDQPSSVIVTLANARAPDTPQRLMADSVANVVSVMEKHSIQKLVVMSSFGTADSLPNVILPMRFAIQHTNLGVSYVDHGMVDKEVKATGLDFVLVRPNRLTNGPKAPVKVFDDAGKRMGGFMSISRASVASFLMDAVEQNIWNRRTPTIAN